MKTIEDILNNYKEYETFMDDRFGRRFCKFLTVDQVKQLGFEFKDDEARKNHKQIPFTEENILKQLKEDVEFGWEKACDERGISSSLMYEVVLAWCKVLENDFADWTGESREQYKPYGKPLFRAVAKKYGWELEEWGADDEQEY